jgi:heptosyltransferase II
MIPKKIGKKNILVVKLWAIGESVLVLPSVKALRKLYPDCKISVLCTDYNRKVFANCKYVDNVIIFSPSNFLSIILRLRKENFRLSVDFEPYTKISSVISYLSGSNERVGFSNRKLLYTSYVKPKNIHAVNNFIRLVKILGNVEYPKELVKMNIQKFQKTKAVKFSKSLKGIRIGIHAGLGSSSSIRRWNEKNFSSLCDEIVKKYNATIVLTGSKNEKPLNRKIISLCEKNTQNRIVEFYENLTEFSAFVSYIDVFIANDSGPMHIAASMGTPTVGLFGPNMPNLYGPYGNFNVGIYKGPSEPYIKPFEGRFPEKYIEEYDVNRIQVSDVMQAVKKILKRGGTRPS